MSILACAYLLSTVSAQTFYGEATPLSIGSSDAPLTEKELLDAISWSEDGVDESIVSDTYLGSSKIGTYYYVVEGTLNGEVKRVANTIEVIDNTAPVVTIKTIKIGNNTKLSEQDLISNCVAHDNLNDVLTYEIINNKYNETIVPGTYTYEVKVTDVNNNFTIQEGTIIVEDNTVPTIIGSSKIVSTYELSDDEIINQYQIYDDTSDNLDIYIDRKDGITLYAKDEEGNITCKSIDVEVIERGYEVIFIANQCKVASSYELTLNNLKSVASYLLNISEEDITAISSDYLENITTVGSYEVSVTCLNQNYTFTLEVYKKEDVKEESSNWFMKILKSIGRFFKKVWKWVFD